MNNTEINDVNPPHLVATVLYTPSQALERREGGRERKGKKRGHIQTLGEGMKWGWREGKVRGR